MGVSKRQPKRGGGGAVQGQRSLSSRHRVKLTVRVRPGVDRHVAAVGERRLGSGGVADNVGANHKVGSVAVDVVLLEEVVEVLRDIAGSVVERELHTRRQQGVPGAGGRGGAG